jgi:ATP-dependent RNA helicase HelY
VVGLVKQIRKNDLAAAEQLESAVCHLGNFEEYAAIRMEIKETERLLSRRDGRRTFDNRQRQHMENELDGLRRRLRQHECHSCNDRETHARFAERAARLNRESAGLRERVENRTHVIAKTFDRICDVLTHLGYIEGEKPLEQGKILAKIYAESDLLLTETIRNGILDSLSPPELVSVISSVIYESRGSENYSPKMPHQNVATALASIASIWSQLADVEEDFGVDTQKEPDFGFCFAAYRWASGHSLSSILKGSDMTVGDFVRNIKQLIDLLTQIAGASENLRKNCREAIKRIDRGVVSYMVGEL